VEEDEEVRAALKDTGRDPERSRPDAAPEDASPSRGGAPTTGFLAAYTRAFVDEAYSAVRHEVLNRVMAVNALTYMIKRAWGDSADHPYPMVEGVDAFERVSKEMARATDVLGRRFSDGSVDEHASTDLEPTLARVARLIGGAGGVELSLPGPPVRVSIDGLDLEVALACVLQNAREALPPGAKHRPVRCALVARGDDEVTVVIEDEGEGWAEEAEKRAFQRLYSTKRGHAGLGLSVARSLLGRWGGRIALGPRADGRPGASVRLDLPTVPAGAARGSAER
jgi:signal transduction histidine kinase